MKARLTSQAYRDLAEIAEYINNDNPAAADRFLERIDDFGEKLGITPDLGFDHNQLPPSIRYWPVGRYVIFYRIDVASVWIVRILHGARDWAVLFQEPHT